MVDKNVISRGFFSVPSAYSALQSSYSLTPVTELAGQNHNFRSPLARNIRWIEENLASLLAWWIWRRQTGVTTNLDSYHRSIVIMSYAQWESVKKPPFAYLAYRNAMYFVATAIVKGKTPCPDRTEIINTRLQDLVAVARLRGDNVVAPIPMDQEVAPFQSDGIVNLATRYPNEPGAVIKDTLRITPRQRRSPE